MAAHTQADSGMSFLERASEPLVSLSRSPTPAPRGCKDLVWLFIFAAYWAGMAYVGTFAVQQGDPRRLVEGLDDDNQLCGSPDAYGEHADDVPHGLSSRPYVYFACLQYGRRRPTVCVSQCPTLSGHYVRWYNGSIIHCESSSGRPIPATTYPTTGLGFSCVPSAATLYFLVASTIDVSAFTGTITGMLLAWPDVLLAAVAASLLALAWMRCVPALAPRGLLAPVTIGFTLASLTALSVALWSRAMYLTNESFAEETPVLQGSLQVAVNTDMSLALAVVTTALSVGVVVALWCGLGHRLLQSGGILAEAAEALSDMPSLLAMLPPVALLLLGLLWAYWLVVSILLASAGHPSHGYVHYSNEAVGMFAYLTVGLLWTAEMVLHLTFCASAGAVSRWYFASAETAPPPPAHEDGLGHSGGNGNGNGNGGGGGGSSGACQLGSSAVARAILRTLRYSIGSLAIGSLLVIPGRVFRFFLEHCLHQAQTDGRGKPELRGVAHCCLRCCLDAGTRYLQYISHNAYIYVSVHDLSFCEGAKQAFELTLRNIGQVSVLTAGERLLLSIAKLGIACTCTACAAVAISLQVSLFTALENANGALVLTFFVTFCAADAWLSVYDAAAEAIFLCYLVDQEENDGDVRPYYASPALQDYMGRHRPTYQLPEETGLSPDISPSHIRSPSPEKEAASKARVGAPPPAASGNNGLPPAPPPPSGPGPRKGLASLGKGD